MKFYLSLLLLPTMNSSRIVWSSKRDIRIGHASMNFLFTKAGVLVQRRGDSSGQVDSQRGVQRGTSKKRFMIASES